MPELPEVETIVRDLAPHLIGRTLRKPRLHRADVLRRVTKRRLLQSVEGQQVRAVSRRAKHAVFLLRNGLRMVIQPRMTGTIMVHRGTLDPDERPYVVFEARIGRRDTLVYRDVRRLGTIWLLKEREWDAYTARIGPEPLDDDFDASSFACRLRGSRQAIKKVLMDQRRIAGVGNIYANEALFRAGIDPSCTADCLDRDEIVRLHQAVRDVLAAAIAAKGTTVRDYRTGTGQSGSFQHVLEVYGRGGLPCSRCGTVLATTHAIDGRATTFCWRCQGVRQ